MRAQQSGGHGTVAPPVPIPNTEVKRCCADDSMTKGHAKVGHRQIHNPPCLPKGVRGDFFCTWGALKGPFGLYGIVPHLSLLRLNACLLARMSVLR